MAETTMTAMMIANANGDGADGGREIKKNEGSKNRVTR